MKAPGHLILLAQSYSIIQHGQSKPPKIPIRFVPEAAVINYLLGGADHYRFTIAIW